MEDHLLPICENQKINPIFVKANSALILKFKSNFENLNATEKAKLLEKLWVTESNGIIERLESSMNVTTESWTGVKFNNNTELMMFVLRWS